MGREGGSNLCGTKYETICSPSTAGSLKVWIRGTFFFFWLTLPASSLGITKVEVQMSLVVVGVVIVVVVVVLCCVLFVGVVLPFF